MTERILDEQLDREIRRFLEWQAEDVHGAPTPTQMAIRIGSRSAAGGAPMLRSPRLAWIVLAGVLLATLIGVGIGAGWLKPPSLLSPGVLPENGWIAYSTRAHGAASGDAGEIFVVREGFQPEIVRRGDSRITVCPSFSPNGTMLSLLEGDELVILSGDPSTGMHEQRTVDLLGAGRTPATCPIWQPSGAGLGILVTEGLLIWKLDGTMETRVLEVGQTYPSAYSDFAWAPDGSAIALAREGGVFVAALDGSPPRRLTTTPPSFVSWSPDGSRLAFSDQAADGLPNEVKVLDLGEGGAAVNLGVGDFPAWSPRGDSIAFASPDGVVVVGPDGSARRVVSDRGYGFGGWSPDGERLLIMVDSSGEGWDLHMLSATAGTRTVLVRDIATGSARNFPNYLDVSWQPVYP